MKTLYQDKNRQSLVYMPLMTSGQEMELVYSYNPGTVDIRHDWFKTWTRMALTRFIHTHTSSEAADSTNWRVPWKNRISSTSMKLRKSLLKPVTWQNILSCSVLSHEIVMHDAFNVILWTSSDKCVIMHDDLGWKNRTTRCNRFRRVGCSRLEYIDIRLVY